MEKLEPVDWIAYPRGKRTREAAIRVSATTWVEARNLAARRLRLPFEQVWAEAAREKTGKDE